MSLGRAALIISVWLPIIAVPVMIWVLSEGLTKPLRVEAWLFFGAIVIVELMWIGFHRWSERFEEFCKKYPGYRMKD